MHAPTKASDVPFGASPGPTYSGKEKQLISHCFGYQVSLTFSGGGARGPSTIFMAVWLYGHVAMLLPRRVPPSIYNLQNKNCGATPACTFVGTPHKCGFHSSNVDGWLIRNTLALD